MTRTAAREYGRPCSTSAATANAPAGRKIGEIAPAEIRQRAEPKCSDSRGKSLGGPSGGAGDAVLAKERGECLEECGQTIAPREQRCWHADEGAGRAALRHQCHQPEQYQSTGQGAGGVRRDVKQAGETVLRKELRGFHRGAGARTGEGCSNRDPPHVSHRGKGPHHSPSREQNQIPGSVNYISTLERGMQSGDDPGRDPGRGSIGFRTE